MISVERQFHIRRHIEAVTTRRSWKFASIAVAKTLKSLATPDFFGMPTAAQKRISKRISKTIEYLMISVERQFHIRRGIEAVITRRSWKPFGGNPTRVRIPSSPPPKSLEDTTFSRLFSFFALWLFRSFLPDFYRFSRKFSAHKKFRKPLLHKGFLDLLLETFLENSLICVVHFNLDV